MQPVDLEKAGPALREGPFLVPDDGRLRYGLGIVLRDSGDMGNALAASWGSLASDTRLS